MIRISPDQKTQFEKEGVVCLRNVLTQAELALLRAGVARQLSTLGTSRTAYDFEAVARQIWTHDEKIETGAATRFDMTRMKQLVEADEQASQLLETAFSGTEKGCFFYDVAGWKKDAGIREVAFDSALPELVRQLLDADYLNFWEDTTFVKAPGTRQRTAFHQDLAYFQIQGTQCVIVWIPLDPANLENGVTEYVRGSHKWGETYAPNVFIATTPLSAATDGRCPDIDANRSDYDIISFDVEPGDVIIHHVMTLHGAGGNMSDRFRRAMSFRYCGDQIRYYDRPGAIQQVGVSHDLQTGDRLLSDDYPVVWPKPWPSARLADLYENTFADQDTGQMREESSR